MDTRSTPATAAGQSGLPVARDPFERLVHELAADMTNLRAPVQQLADEAHYSRQHFERIIGAVAGERPTAFLKRILMERAAYRMIHTDRNILDIAQEAGFSSNEAFTRAFRRSYGVTPSLWRRRPTRFQIAAPNGVHFHPPAGLRLPPRDRSVHDDVAVQMVEHHVFVTTQLVDQARTLTEEQLDAPIAARIVGIDGDNLRWLLSRLIGQMDMWLSAIHDREYDFGIENTEPVAGMRSRLERVGPEFVRAVRTVAHEGRFDETFVDAFYSPPMIVSYGAMVSHVLTYAAHHRTLAVARLSELGITDLAFGDPKVWFTLLPPATTVRRDG